MSAPTLVNFYAPSRITNKEQLRGIYTGSNFGCTLTNPDSELTVPVDAAPQFILKVDGADAIDLSAYISFTDGDWPLVINVPYAVTAGIAPGAYTYDVDFWAGFCALVGEMPVTGQVE